MCIRRFVALNALWISLASGACGGDGSGSGGSTVQPVLPQVVNVGGDVHARNGEEVKVDVAIRPDAGSSDVEIART